MFYCYIQSKILIKTYNIHLSWLYVLFLTYKISLVLLHKGNFILIISWKTGRNSKTGKPKCKVSSGYSRDESCKYFKALTLTFYIIMINGCVSKLRLVSP